MGFEFSETMAGTVRWDSAPDVAHPFKFDVTAHAESTRQHLADGRAELTGTIDAPPIAEGAALLGVITIRPIGQRIIRYELSFTGDDGKPYELVGQKDISWLSPLRTFTYLPAEILDEKRRRIGRCETAFDYKRHLWSFLRSFRPVR
ncbi:MAG: hypothetical protein KF773_28050 [Deltaproteobacteria bacterium]|nr:hypothetical protein [Deltaproteobacteria bacterium]MCW5803290.1 hypothetical protein [Deltaproteobacteria bacterium]